MQGKQQRKVAAYFIRKLEKNPAYLYEFDVV
jgi:hypothetical protein